MNKYKEENAWEKGVVKSAQQQNVAAAFRASLKCELSFLPPEKKTY